MCHICRNTLALQVANSQHELVLSSCKMESLKSFQETIEKVDFDSLTAQLQKMQSFDLHLQHLLLNEDSLKAQQSQSKTIDDSVQSISCEMLKLQDQVTELVNRPQSVPQSTLASSDDFLSIISDKLDQLCANEPRISTELDNLKQSIGNLERLHQDQIDYLSHVPVRTDSVPIAPINVDRMCPSGFQNSSRPVDFSVDDFISVEAGNELILMLDAQAENGHSVLNFGEPYKYSGSRTMETATPIPSIVQSVLESINEQYCRDGNPQMNSCLVNRYVGSTSHLPKHSDDEPSIHPESSIFTLSIGQHCSVVFGNLSGSDAHTQACNPRSLYGMTRMSQDFFKHHIEAGTIENGTRYSLTFRSLSFKNRNTTCIIGDSNTGRLKFGSDPRQSFGDLLPGKQVYSPVLDEINPYVCAGYRNVVLLCGVNDLRKECVKSEKDVHNIFRKFVQKIEQIQSINPHCRIYVCPILPTKLVNINRRAACFNGLIFNELVSSNFGVTVVNGFDSFLDNEGLLHQNLSKRLNKHQRPDFLHLNWKGSAQLAKLIKNTIFHRASNMVNGRSYRDVAAPGLGEHHNGYQPV